MKTIDSLIRVRNSEYFRGFEGIDGPTPLSLCELQINKIPCDYTNPNFKWMFPAVGHGTYAVVVYWKYMEGLSEIFINNEERSRHILKNMLYLIENNPTFCDWLRQDGFINVIEGDYLKHNTKMKFDVVIGNPPYQKKVGPKKTEAIWPKFVQKSFDICKEGGYVSLIHPSGWRNVDGKFKETQKLLLSKDIKYLEMHNEKDGLRLFGAETRYDWYVVNNVNNNGDTVIKGQRGDIININLNGKEFIPNDNLNTIYSLLPQNNEETVEILHSYSDYETRKPHMSKNRTEEHRYPIVYTVPKGDTLNLLYSSHNTNKHFGVPKLIWSNGRVISVGSVVDINGDYGLTQFSYAIVDEPENLPLIKKVFDSKIFRDLMEDCAVSDMSINRKIISTFRKDFWRDFLDEDNNVIDPNYNVERV